MSSKFFEIVHGNNAFHDPPPKEPELPGMSMLFRVPSFDDMYFVITILLVVATLCDLIVNFLRDNKYLSKFTKPFIIQNIVFVLGGSLSHLVRDQIFYW